MRKIKLLWVIMLLTIAIVARAEDKVLVVDAGNAASLLQAIEQANKQNADSAAERLYILIPDGLYDLGQRTLTAITGHNIALIGQSMANTIIRNAPPVEQEGISKTATLQNRSTGLYLQDLTLQNALDYYSSGAAGRAVCLHDKGSNTICNHVRMLSYQDTYYTDNDTGLSYLRSCEIHGTVDFICGTGDAYFDHCTIVTERRTRDGKGRNVIVAPRTSKTQWGYVFDGCAVYNRMSGFQYARGWHTHPRCVWLNTTLFSPEKLLKPRFDSAGMRTVNSDFYEYNTRDAKGKNITPKSNVVTFVCNDEQRTLETVISARQARTYRLKNVFPGWRPEKKLRQMEREAARLKKVWK